MNNLSDLNNWERQKAIFMMHEAEQFGLKLSKYSQIGVNPHSGYTWVWDEDWSICLYMPIDCELQTSDIWVCWTNPDDGEEYEETLKSFSTIDEMHYWVAQLEKALQED